jgi:hypothetical protein
MRLLQNRPKRSPNGLLTNVLHNFYGGKKLKNSTTFVIYKKTTQGKQLHNSRKFAQSGHPALQSVNRADPADPGRRTLDLNGINQLRCQAALTQRCTKKWTMFGDFYNSIFYIEF